VWKTLHQHFSLSNLRSASAAASHLQQIGKAMYFDVRKRMLFDTPHIAKEAGTTVVVPASFG
jgi:rhodanese-related sulfurtransferase